MGETWRTIHSEENSSLAVNLWNQVIHVLPGGTGMGRTFTYQTGEIAKKEKVMCPQQVNIISS